MPRKGRIDIVGKLERIEQEQLADELPELVRAVRGEWREQCRQRAGATAQLDLFANSTAHEEYRAS